MKQAVHAPSSPLPSHSPLRPTSHDNRAPSPSSNPLIQVSRRVSLLYSVGPCPSHPHSPAQRSIHHPAPPRHPRELPVIDTSSPGHTHARMHTRTPWALSAGLHTHALGFIFNLEPVTSPGHSQTPARPPGRPFNCLSAQGGIRYKDKSRTARLERNSILLT